jgi:hypothetical protein
MSRCWLALVKGPVEGAHASARTSTIDGQEIGTLAAWRQNAKPVRDALRVDERLIDSSGSSAWISLVLVPTGVQLPFDDLAVQQARRLTLSRPPPDAVSTLLRDNSQFSGAITVARSVGTKQWLRTDPFAQIHPAMLLEVEAGILGSVTALTGPTIERYGSGNPWPWDRFT